MIQIDRKVGVWTILGFIVLAAGSWGTLQSQVSAQAIRLAETKNIADDTQKRIQVHEVAVARITSKAEAVDDKLNRLLITVDRIADKLDKRP